MMPVNASAAFTPNQPSSDAKALSLFLIHSFRPASSLGGHHLLMPHHHPHLVIMPQQVPDGHPDSHEYGSDCNNLLPKQSSDLFSQ